jgi:hypothetical protein
MFARWIRLVSVALIVVFMLATVGCYGSFNLVKKVYTWNGKLGDKWLNEVAFLALCIVPVYEIAGGIDAVVLNSLEFWTGKNPVSADNGRSVTISKDGFALTVTTTGDGALVMDASGLVLARSVRTTDGVSVYDAQGTLLGSMTNDQLAAYIATE